MPLQHYNATNQLRGNNYHLILLLHFENSKIGLKAIPVFIFYLDRLLQYGIL